MALIDLQTLITVGLAFAMGGILKGATGIGAPLIAVPVMTGFVDIRFAVAVFVVPNLVTNLIQSIIYRRALTNRLFLLILCMSAGLGAFAGSLMLYQTSGGILKMLMAGLILFYVAFRLYKPNWQLLMSTAHKLNIPMGFIAGFLQGAFGISAPATLTFLNAIKFERSEFIIIVSVFFMTMSLIQLPTLFYLGLMQIDHLILGLLAVIPLIGFMPVGAFILRRATPDLFDRVILAILVGVALRLIWAG
jgi:uncharacterized membrane protein YfcA